jgi:hypothetical protein
MLYAAFFSQPLNQRAKSGCGYPPVREISEMLNQYYISSPQITIGIGFGMPQLQQHRRTPGSSQHCAISTSRRALQKASVGRIGGRRTPADRQTKLPGKRRGVGTAWLQIVFGIVSQGYAAPAGEGITAISGFNVYPATRFPFEEAAGNSPVVSRVCCRRDGEQPTSLEVFNRAVGPSRRRRNRNLNLLP